MTTATSERLDALKASLANEVGVSSLVWRSEQILEVGLYFLPRLTRTAPCTNRAELST